MVESPLITVAEAAHVWHVSARTVQRMCIAGEVPAVRVRGQWRIDTSGTVTARQDRTPDYEFAGRLR